MKLATIAEQPRKALRYLERYVNDGSPSGFSELHSLTRNYGAYGSNPWFNLLSLKADRKDCEIFPECAVLPEIYLNQSSTDEIIFYVHPEMGNHSQLVGTALTWDDELRVSPTASGRTVELISAEHLVYIKLHYDGVIGRVSRGLPRSKAIAGPEIAMELKHWISSGKAPRPFAFLDEPFAVVVNTDEGAEWGLVHREGIIRAHDARENRFLVPFFSLFSVDRLEPLDQTILEQIHMIQGGSSIILLGSDIVTSVIECYFSMVHSLGFQMEINAQNLLVEFDSSWRFKGIVLRDLMGVEKDLSIRKDLGLSTKFCSEPYKTISNEHSVLDWQIRHSFAFDFKLSTYVIKPVVDEIDRILGKPSILMKVAKETSLAQIMDLPADYFPADGSWYRHERVLLTTDRKYVSMSNPLLR